mmetsp:Transcript_4325/g.7903  ORF Transcript_4325/g.7903 Transcript_4325/m.7903 type:complete len:323 (+) Transcript_4325:346-1314(+)
MVAILPALGVFDLPGKEIGGVVKIRQQTYKGVFFLGPRSLTRGILLHTKFRQRLSQLFHFGFQLALFRQVVSVHVEQLHGKGDLFSRAHRLKVWCGSVVQVNIVMVVFTICSAAACCTRAGRASTIGIRFARCLLGILQLFLGFLAISFRQLSLGQLTIPFHQDKLGHTSTLLDFTQVNALSADKWADLFTTYRNLYSHMLDQVPCLFSSLFRLSKHFDSMGRTVVQIFNTNAEHAWNLLSGFEIASVLSDTASDHIRRHFKYQTRRRLSLDLRAFQPCIQYSLQTIEPREITHSLKVNIQRNMDVGHGSSPTDHFHIQFAG